MISHVRSEEFRQKEKHGSVNFDSYVVYYSTVTNFQRLLPLRFQKFLPLYTILSSFFNHHLPNSDDHNIVTFCNNFKSFFPFLLELSSFIIPASQLRIPIEPPSFVQQTFVHLYSSKQLHNKNFNYAVQLYSYKRISIDRQFFQCIRSFNRVRGFYRRSSLTSIVRHSIFVVMYSRNTCLPSAYNLSAVPQPLSLMITQNVL